MRNFAIILSLLATIGCKKETITFTISGKITDKSLNSNLSDATTSISERPAGTSDWKPITSIETGSQGEYSFTFERKQSESYLINIAKDNYFPLEKLVYFSELSVENNNIRNYDVYAFSWVKLRFVNSNPDPTKQIIINQQEGVSGCAGCFPDDTAIGFQGPVDTTIVYYAHGNTSFEYSYNVTGTADVGTRSIQTIPFDTVEIILNY